MQGVAPLTILLVEDSADDSFIFERTLKKSGINSRLFSVSHGTAAVDYLKRSIIEKDPESPRPDIIFLDLKLPQLSGFDVLNWIRGQNFFPPVHVIVLSGSDEVRDQKLSLELGAAEFFTKPISVSDLQKRLLDAPRFHSP